MTTALESSIPLAAFDYLPVLLTAAGAWLLGERLSGHTRTGACRAAAVLLALGGGAKATWKLLLALDGGDVGLLFHALFPCLAVAFSLVIAALGSELGRRQAVWLGWSAAVALALVASAVLRDDALLLVATAVGTTWVGIELAVLSRRRGVVLPVALALLWVVGSSALAPLASHVQTTSLAWLEQSLNSAVQACLLLAVLALPRPAAGVALPSPLTPKEVLA